MDGNGVFTAAATSQTITNTYTQDNLGRITDVEQDTGPSVKYFPLELAPTSVSNPLTAGVLDATGRANVWKLAPRERGQVIEKHLAQTEYQDWFHVGAEQLGFFPLIDFQKGQSVVSLKTADTRGGSWIGDLQSHIDDLATRGVQINDRPASLFLDLRVQPGGLEDAQQLIGYGKKVGVTVRIQEF